MRIATSRTIETSLDGAGPLEEQRRHPKGGEVPHRRERPHERAVVFQDYDAALASVTKPAMPISRF